MEPITPSDYMQLSKLEDLYFKGSNLVFVEKKPKNGSEYITIIQRIRTQVGEQDSITAENRIYRSPKISIGGKLAYLSKQNGHSSVILEGAPEPLTPHWMDIQRFEWSPDGTKLAAIGRIVPNTQALSKEELDQLHKDKTEPRVVKNLIYRSGTSYINEWEVDQVFTIEIQSGVIRRISDENYQYQGVSWLTNSEVVAITKLDQPADLSDYLDLVVLDINQQQIGGSIGRTYHPYVFDKLIEVNSFDTSIIAIQMYDPSYSQGKRYQKLKWQLLGHTEYDGKILNDSLDRSLAQINWINETEYWGLVHHHGNSEVRHGTIEDGLNNVYDPEFSVETMVSDENGGFYCIATSPRYPSALYHYSDGEFNLVYDPNPWISSKQIVKPVVRWFENPEGLRYQGWFFNAGEGSPLLLSIHGGPHIMWNNAGTMWLEWQSQVASGYSILALNPVGSDGYGEKFLRVIVGNWGKKDARDLLTAMDEICETHDVDQDRLYICGGSYAGFQTVNIIGKDNRFRAACAQRGVYNLLTLDAGGDLARFEEIEYLGLYKGPKQIEKLWNDSPISKVDAITTPLLLIHSEQDYRVPIHQAEQLFLELRQRGMEIEFVRYPRNGHELSRAGEPKFVIDRLDRMVDWFDGH